MTKNFKGKNKEKEKEKRKKGREEGGKKREGKNKGLTLINNLVFTYDITGGFGGGAPQILVP